VDRPEPLQAAQPPDPVARGLPACTSEFVVMDIDRSIDQMRVVVVASLTGLAFHW
jgi:hypothetical protein